MIHNSIVYSFGKLGIGKLGKQELPILVVDPLNLPKDWPLSQPRRNKVDKVRKRVLLKCSFACWASNTLLDLANPSPTSMAEKKVPRILVWFW